MRSALFALLACSSALGAETLPACFSGTYALSNGNVVDAQEAGEKRMTWHALDGRWGVLEPIADGRWRALDGANETVGEVSFGACSDRSIRFLNSSGKAAPLVVEETRFQSGTASLKGRLILPPGRDKVTIIVFGPGSERQAATDYAFQQRLFPAAGVGFFVYDKRGTGGSGGPYTQNFDTLAQDAVAAIAEARRLAGSRLGRIGFSGVNQSGWVLPLAATRTKVDFVIINSGVPGTPLDEAFNRTEAELIGTGGMWEAQQISDAVAVVLRTRGKSGLPELYAIVRKYRSEAWFRDLKSGPTAEVVALAIQHTERELREMLARTDWSVEPTWEADSIESLRQLTSPVLWLLAGEDTG